MLTPEVQKDLESRGVSRRNFGQIAAALGAGVSALTFLTEAGLAQASKVDAPPDAILINANENPLGPCDEARQAVHNMVQYGGRYRYSEGDRVQKILADQEGLKLNYVRIHPGSSGPLHQSVFAFTSPTRPLVMADPSYESAAAAARFVGSKVIRVPLTKDYAHDVRAMAAASPEAGMIYIVNPNNPTGTLTSQADLEWLVANKPKGAIVVIDEAYTHFSNAQFQSPMIAADKDVVVLRTFSKIYGMAGLRAGAALARPDLNQKISQFSQTMMPITGMAAASASLEVKDLIPKRRKFLADTREDVQSWLSKNHYSYVPSVSNCLMVDVKRPGGEIVKAMQADKVYIGRIWPAWPTHVRVTIGLPEEMEAFKKSFTRVMSA